MFYCLDPSTNIKRSNKIQDWYEELIPIQELPHEKPFNIHETLEGSIFTGKLSATFARFKIKFFLLFE